MVSGEQFAVMNSGMTVMLVLFVNNWDFRSMVRRIVTGTASTQTLMTTTAGSIAASHWNVIYAISAAIHHLECDGTEENVFDCQFSSDSNSTCGMYQDASMICQGLITLSCILLDPCFHTSLIYILVLELVVFP